MKDALGIPGTSYKIQLGIIDERWALHLLKGQDVIDFYILKDEDVKDGIPKLDVLVGWLLRTLALPNIGTHNIITTVQALIRLLIKKRVFQFSDELGEYQELKLTEDFPLGKLLDSDFILLFVDPRHSRVWIWQGINTTTRMKFISARLADRLRDRYGIVFKITYVDEGNETSGFKALILEEDLESDESLSRERILLLLKMAGVPEGDDRKVVVVGDKIYSYKEYEKNYLGSVIKEKKLLSFDIKKMIVVLSYSLRKEGLKVFFSYPLEFLSRDLSDKIVNNMDQQMDKGGFGGWMKDIGNLKILNYCIEISSDWARGNKEMLMLSIKSHRRISHEDREIISLIFRQSFDEMPSNKEFFKVFYINEMKNFDDAIK